VIVSEERDFGHVQESYSKHVRVFYINAQTTNQTCAILIIDRTLHLYFIICVVSRAEILRIVFDLSCEYVAACV